MPDLSPDAWAQIRHDYEHTERPVADICAEHGISSGTLRDRVRRWRWTPRRAPIPWHGPPAAAAPLREISPQDFAEPSPWPLGPRLHGDERGELRQEDFLPASTPTPALALSREGSADPAPHLAPGDSVTAPDAGDPASIAARLQGAVARVLPAIEAAVARLAAGPQHPREMEQTARALGTMMRTLRELNALLAQQPSRGRVCDCDDMPEDLDEFRDRLAQRIDALLATPAEEVSAEEQAAATADK